MGSGRAARMAERTLVARAARRRVRRHRLRRARRAAVGARRGARPQLGHGGPGRRPRRRIRPRADTARALDGPRCRTCAGSSAPRCGGPGACGCSPTSSRGPEFATNRTGLVVLHPPALAGAALHVRHSDGAVAHSRFPERISPHQPALDIAGLSWSHDGLERRRALHRRRVRDGGPAQLDGCLVQDVQPPARAALPLHARRRRTGRAVDRHRGVGQLRGRRSRIPWPASGSRRDPRCPRSASRPRRRPTRPRRPGRRTAARRTARSSARRRAARRAPTLATPATGERRDSQPGAATSASWPRDDRETLPLDVRFVLDDADPTSIDEAAARAPRPADRARHRVLRRPGRRAMSPTWTRSPCCATR